MYFSEEQKAFGGFPRETYQEKYGSWVDLYDDHISVRKDGQWPPDIILYSEIMAYEIEENTSGEVLLTLYDKRMHLFFLLEICFKSSLWNKNLAKCLMR